MKNNNDWLKQTEGNPLPMLFHGLSAFHCQKVRRGARWLYLTTLVVALALQWTIPVPTAYAAGLNVDSTADTEVSGDGDCTLREAILNANTDSDTTSGDCTGGSGPDTITFSVTGVITLANMLPRITTHITLRGPDAPGLTISGNNAVSIFFVEDPGTLNLEKLTLTDARGYGMGAIFNYSGNVIVTNSTFSGNKGSGGGAITNFWGGSVTVLNSVFSGNYANWGGGLYSDSGSVSVSDSHFTGNIGGFNGGAIDIRGGTLAVTGSSFTNNTIFHVAYPGSGGGGGGIYNRAGTVAVTNSTFLNNSAYADAGYGGGIFNDWGGTLTVIGSTFSGNSAYQGGGIQNLADSRLIVDRSTFSGNRAMSSGGAISNEFNDILVVITNSTFSGNTVFYNYYNAGGIYNLRGTIDITNSTFFGNKGAISSLDSYSTVTLRNTILAHSTTVNCEGSITDGGHNLQFPAASGCDSPGFLTADPLLGPLQDNGGFTFTHALLPRSPAIDAVPLADCAGVATDQRGVERPQGPACDIGAYEFGSPKKSIEGLIKQVLQLTETGTLNGGQGNSLIAKLEAAIGQLDRGNDRVAVNQLRSFTNEVEAKLRSGLLSAEEGQPLIDAANEIIALLSS